MADRLKHICVLKPESNTYHGYKLALLEKELDDFLSLMILCESCNGILREPCLTDTGKYKCKSCLDNENGNLDEIKMKAIAKLSCCCPFKKKGCLWEGTIRQLPEHNESCKYIEINCCYKELGCDTKRRRLEMDSHETESHIKHLKMMSKHISAMKEEIKELQVKINENELKSKRSENFEWRVRGVSEKIENNQKQLSKCFHVELYRLQASIYLCNDEENALSVYIHVCRGEFDKCLDWPLDACITITLVSNISPKRNISFALKTREYESYFSRQFEGKSKGWGFCMAKQELILRGEYSESDEIAVRIEVAIQSKCKQI